ncbi:LysM peptidoglycan-binding domain-containing protein [Sphingomonas immobilis]|uniref:LysM peptidoglycan-binding domain-containing protein n=1 Tax=Sphingomonas immobilis TaxID=3063997 RepID=A0ABT9A0J3_9SPHN|nr:LysM peptidoglycan-binding domain-containing protein [Sphingomonas sp. CA1-15]MDO7842511.1 LysM peptidoglycan-binding domain-containing protein [Sphingomonas sp. CA1-15]
MTIFYRLRGALVATCALAVAACNSGTPRPSVTPPPPAARGAAGVDAIADLLDAGNERAAKKEIKALLKREPMNASALLLKSSIDGDPKEQLGPNSYPYTVRPGDSIAGIARRLLGNRLKAYQLTRYNGLKAPVALQPGQTLRIPGTPPAPPAPVRKPEPDRVPPPAVAPKPKSVAPKPVAPAANPAAARAARTAGLAALNQGQVTRAVALLRRAAALDPANPVIAKDLARAQRIAATVKAH